MIFFLAIHIFGPMPFFRLHLLLVVNNNVTTHYYIAKPEQNTCSLHLSTFKKAFQKILKGNLNTITYVSSTYLITVTPHKLRLWHCITSLFLVF